MFGIGRIVVGAVAWGLGSSLGRELYTRIKSASPWAEETDSPSSIQARVVELEKELSRLRKQSEAGTGESTGA